MSSLSRLFTFLIYCYFLFGSYECLSAEKTTTIKITGIAQNGIINTAYLRSAKEFEKLNPNVKIQLQFQPDNAFKRNLPSILSDTSSVDIVIMHAGKRLQQAIKNNQILPITSLWHNNNFKDEFSDPMKNAVSRRKEIYGVPFSYYMWGFYYIKSYFKSLNITPPITWQDFTAVLAKIKKTGVNPLFIGTKNPWPIGAWFEYLNLRINGIAFHNEFIKGNVNSYSPKIYNVLSYLKELIDKEYFIEDHQDKTLLNGLPNLIRRQAALSLAGGSFENVLPTHLKDDISFFSFPKIDENMPDFQVSPIDVVSITAASKQPNTAMKFLTYMASASVQTLHNQAINQLPANLKSTTSITGIPKISINYLRQASGLTLFYDREVESKYGLDNLAIWTDFLNNSSIELTQRRMEAARQSYLLRANIKVQ